MESKDVFLSDKHFLRLMVRIHTGYFYYILSYIILNTNKSHA